MARIDQLKAAFGVIHILPPEREEIDTILELAQLVVDVDGDEHADEISLFFQIGRALYEMAEVEGAEIPTFASDEEDEHRLFELATNLKSTPARELAFAVARALAEADLDIAPTEDVFVDRLRSLLSINKERAVELDTLLRSA